MNQMILGYAETGSLVTLVRTDVMLQLYLPMALLMSHA